MHKAKERLAQMERRHLLIACLIVVTLGAAIVAITIALVANTQSAPKTSENSPISVSGEMVCLPHKANGDAYTLECAYGLRTDDNRHYALQYEPFPHDAQIGQRIHVTGTLTAGGDSAYDVAGTIKITAFTQP